MSENILLAAAVFPVVVLCYFIYQKDVNKEPKNLLTKLFVLGFLITVPILPCELFLDSFFSTEKVTNFFMIFFNTFISIGLVEEGFKWIVTKKVGYDSNEFDEIYDIIVYSVFVSLGFACIENILYVFTHGLGNAIMRALTSIPGHTCFAVIMGYFFSKAKINSINQNSSSVTKNLIFSILAPALVHTMYDAILIYMVNLDGSLFYFFVFILFDVIMVITCFITVNKIAKIQVNLNTNINNGNITFNDGVIAMNTQKINQSVSGSPVQINFCPICGSSVQNMNFCPSCGYKLR